MDEYEVMSLIMRLETRDADPTTVIEMYSETLANASSRLTEDEVRRFLICGAYLAHGPNRNAGGPETLDGTNVAGRSQITIPTHGL
jgi:hypothetical protein